MTQQIDLTEPVGRMVASVMFGLAEIELEFRRERQLGIRVAKQLGTYQGRKPGTTTAKPECAIALKQKGLSSPEIANALKVSERTVFHYLNEIQ